MNLKLMGLVLLVAFATLLVVAAQIDSSDNDAASPDAAAQNMLLAEETAAAELVAGEQATGEELVAGTNAEVPVEETKAVNAVEAVEVVEEVIVEDPKTAFIEYILSQMSDEQKEEYFAFQKKMEDASEEERMQLIQEKFLEAIERAQVS